jgi:hypothetical protein
MGVNGDLNWGADDGLRPEITVEQLQADLDPAGQKLAEEPAWQAQLRAPVAELE